MAAYEVLLLNTAVPQIQAAQAGDTYVVPRDIAVNANMTVTGNVGIGTSSPGYKLHVNGDIRIADTFSLFMGIGSEQKIFVAGGSDSTYLTFNQWTGSAYTERMRLDASGNLGLGVTPSANAGQRGLFVSGVDGGYSAVSIGASQSGYGCVGYNIGFTNVQGTFKALATDAMSWIRFQAGSFQFFQQAAATVGTNYTGTQAMTLDASGNLRVGLTGAAYNAERLTVYKSENAESAAFVNEAGANNYTVAVSNRATTGDNKFMVFATESSDTTRGSIEFNRGAGLVAYNTTSDYRAKDIIGPVQNPGATIDALKVYEGVMKGATQSRPMLIAHEAQEHAPYAVSGVKDEVNEDGTPEFQQMDVSSLVPLLLAEIQSLRARVAQLEGN